MATVQLSTQFSCQTRVSISPNSKSISKPPFLVPVTSIIHRPMISTGGIAVSPRRVFKVRATDTGEIGSALLAAEEAIEDVEETERLKRSLVDSLYGTDRGLSASSETRAEIGDLITQLESKNPTPAPTEALFLLNGKWILAYTSFVNLFPLLSRGIVPLIKVDEISQTIDSDNFTVQNSVRFAGPLGTNSISTNAKFEIRSPKRVQIKFEQGVIGTPQLTDSIEIPEYVEVLGQKIDLNPIRGLLTSVQDTASSVARTISSQPPLKFSLPADNAQSWHGSSVVCYAAPISANSLQWISTISCLALMLARGTGIHKSVVVPLFALHAPSSIVAWIKGEYGVWAAFLALIARLFFTFPGELELPFIALLLVIVAPYQVMNIRGKQEGAIIAIAISGFLAFQHFSRAGSLEKAYEKGSVLATVAIIGVTVVSLLLLL